MNDTRIKLTAASIAVALLGAAGMLAILLLKEERFNVLTGPSTVIYPLWVMSPFLGLGVLGVICRSRLSAALVTLVGALGVALVGLFSFFMAEDAWAVLFLPVLLWIGCGIVLLLQLLRWLFFPNAR